MLDPKQLDEMARRFSENLPSGLRDFQQEVEKNARTAMQTAFSRMDLVTREEFDAQAKVLARTREKLEALEARVAALEAAGSGKASGTASRSGTSRKASGSGGGSRSGSGSGSGSGSASGGGKSGGKAGGSGQGSTG